MSEKLVSVIIPNFNSFKFIKETLDSVFNQTYPHTEIIVIDDGSTDGSYEWIASLENDNLKLFKNKSKGACAARNYGLSKAMGDYIQFLDADDLLDENKIEAQMKCLEHSIDNVAVCSTKHFYETKDIGVITDTPFLYSTNQPHEFLLNLYGADGMHHGMVAQHAWLAPKSVIDKAGRWDENLIKDQDGEFFCRVVMASQGVAYADNTLCYYRKHRVSGSVSSGKSRNHLLSQFRALDSKAAQLNNFKDTREFQNAMALQYKFLAIDAYPHYKDISKQACSKVDQYGGSHYEPILGGKVIEGLKTIFGWRAAKAFSFYAHKYL